jgi:hypothetical protein
MSEKPNLPQEEVDLGTLFSQIGQAFKNLFNSIGKLFKYAFHYGILLILFIRKNYIILGIATLLGIIYGVYKDFNSVPHYESDLIIETNYGSAKQLYKQIASINSLLARKDSVRVAEILKITPAQAGQLYGFNIEPFEKEKQLLSAYDVYMQETDTIYTKNFKIEDFSSRKGDFDLRFHKVTVKAKNQINWKALGKNFSQLAENPFFTDLKNKYLKSLLYEKEKIVAGINNIDSLRIRYDKVAILEATTPKTRTDLNFSTSKKGERNFDIDLYPWVESFLYTLSEVDKKILRHDVVSRVVTNFETGKIISNITWLKSGVLAFLFALFILALIEFNKYLNSYQKVTA